MFHRLCYRVHVNPGETLDACSRPCPELGITVSFPTPESDSPSMPPSVLVRCMEPLTRSRIYHKQQQHLCENIGIMGDGPVLSRLISTCVAGCGGVRLQSQHLGDRDSVTLSLRTVWSAEQVQGYIMRPCLKNKQTKIHTSVFYKAEKYVLEILALFLSFNCSF